MFVTLAALTCIIVHVHVCLSGLVALHCLYNTWIYSPPTELPWWLSGYGAGHVSQRSWVRIPLRAVQLFL